MLEEIIPIEIMVYILSFLDIYSIIKYDSALTNTVNRSIFLDSLKILKCGIANKWSFYRNIQNKVVVCHFTNLKYVTDICYKIIVYGKSLRNRTILPVNIINNNIKYLHIDFIGYNILLNTICGNSIEKIILCNIKRINVDVFVKLSRNCPRLKIIKLLYCSDIFLEEKLTVITNNNSIKISVRG